MTALHATTRDAEPALDPGTQVLTYRYGFEAGASCSIRAPSSLHHDLIGLVGPYVSVGPDGRARRRLSLRVCTPEEIHDALESLGAAPFHGSDYHVQRHGSVEVVLHHRYSQLYQVVVFGAEEITVLIPGAAPTPVPIVAARVVRNIIVADRLAQGAVLVHGSSFAWAGNGVVVLGPKFAGKTTMLCAALSDGASFISNDRTLLDGAHMMGLPVAVGVRRRTLEHFPQLAPFLTAGTASVYEAMEAPNAGRITLPPQGLTSAFGCRITPRARLKGIILAERIAGTRARLEAVPPDDLPGRLAEHVMPSGDVNQPYWTAILARARVDRPEPGGAFPPLRPAVAAFRLRVGEFALEEAVAHLRRVASGETSS